jgi:ATP-binding cassette subfamily C (CFTR/MRP) protein 1
MFRGILVSTLYSKTLDVSIIAAGDSAALVLMSTDVERIVIALPALHEIWAAIAQVAIAAWLLQRELGFPFFVPVVLSFGIIYKYLSMRYWLIIGQVLLSSR